MIIIKIITIAIFFSISLINEAYSILIDVRSKEEWSKGYIVESFERIHRSNLIGMGILPLQFIEDVNRKNLNLIGSELISVEGIENGISPSDKVNLEIKYISGEIKKIKTLCRIDTKNELEYYKNGGILQYVLRNMI